jgi:hypothetical protein
VVQAKSEPADIAVTIPADIAVTIPCAFCLVLEKQQRSSQVDKKRVANRLVMPHYAVVLTRPSNCRHIFYLVLIQITPLSRFIKSLDGATRAKIPFAVSRAHFDVFVNMKYSFSHSAPFV